MKPLFNPASAVRKGGSRDTPVSMSMAMRRSAIAPTSAIASAMPSAASATGSAWKLPPEIIMAGRSPSGAKTSGLSVTALASRSSTRDAWRNWSTQAPTTCGWQRSEYGSCTRSSPR